MVDKMRKEQDKKGGGLLMAADGDKSRFDKLSNVSEDLLIVRVEIMGFEVVIFVIFLDIKDRERNRKIIEDLERYLEKHEDGNIILMGDCNGHLVFIGAQQVNFNGQLIMKLMERWNLTLLNGVEGCIGENTREQGGVSSAIDFVLTNQSMFQTFEKMQIDKRRSEFDLSEDFLLQKFPFTSGKWK